MPSSLGGRIAQVTALQMAEPKLLEYTPASPSPPRHRVRGQKVGIGKVLLPPLDRGERESIVSNPGSVQHTVRHHRSLALQKFGHTRTAMMMRRGGEC
jgi:hypothetical protein